MRDKKVAGSKRKSQMQARLETSAGGVVYRMSEGTLDWYFKDRGKLVHKFCHFFLLECSGGDATPQLEEGISECSWQTIEDALATVTYANAREVLRAAGERTQLPNA